MIKLSHSLTTRETRPQHNQCTRTKLVPHPDFLAGPAFLGCSGCPCCDSQLPPSLENGPGPALFQLLGTHHLPPPSPYPILGPKRGPRGRQCRNKGSQVWLLVQSGPTVLCISPSRVPQEVRLQQRPRACLALHPLHLPPSLPFPPLPFSREHVLSVSRDQDLFLGLCF